MDEDLARRIVDLETLRETAGLAEASEDEPSLPRVTSSAGYSQETYLLMLLCDYVQQLTSTVIAVNLPKGKKPPKVRPLPRPVSAVDRERARREKQEVDATLAELGF
ncbi:hypothetical protein [Nocardia sp. NPDC050435]|uniref:hypothetical protein n=1 Tax=Nocardia sp. NPDC050435 TaxID=3155040 RepID=UPI0033F33A6E